MNIPLAKLKDWDRAHLHPNTAPHLIENMGATFFVAAQGINLQDVEGRTYIDAYSGMGNVILGHGQPDVIAAIKDQTDKLCYVPSFFGYGNAPAAELARMLCDVAPDGINHVHFSNSGSEANEVAFKLARLHHAVRGKPSKTKFISQDGSYHGSTYATMSAGGIPHYRTWFGPGMDGFVFVPAPNAYRTQSNNLAATCIEDLERAIKEHGADNIAGFIVEPIMGVGGHLIPPAEYYPAVREICDRHDILLIADEVVCGFGRTGRMFGMNHWNVTADLISVAKGITSGYVPLSATLISDAIWESILKIGKDYVFPHGTTTSSHPVCCAAGVAVLQVLARDKLIENAQVLGALFLEALKKRMGNSTIVGDIRGLGLLASLELVQDKATKLRFAPEANVGRLCAKEIMERGAIVRSANDIISLRPPLICTRADIDRIVDIVCDGIETVERKLRKAA